MKKIFISLIVFVCFTFSLSAQMNPKYENAKVLLEEAKSITLTESEFKVYLESNPENLQVWKYVEEFHASDVNADLSYVRVLIQGTEAKMNP